MPLPLPKLIPDMPEGGRIVGAMNAANALANNMYLKDINQAKAYYSPITEPANAISKLAYAQFIAPQFIAKAIKDPRFLANISEEQKNNLVNLVANAAERQNNPLNIISNLRNNANAANHQNPLNSFSGWLKDTYKNIIGANANQNVNALNESPLPVVPDQGGHPMELTLTQGIRTPRSPKPHAIPDNELWDTYNLWARSPQGQMKLRQTPNYQPTPNELAQWNANNNPSTQKSFAENTGEFLGEEKQGEELGKFRAKAIDEIGHNQLQLSNTGANVDRLINDFTDPTFIQLRETLPFFQDTQLKALQHVGSPQQREFIGKVIGDIEAFKGATVMGFKGQTLKREFDYADKLKPTTNDTVYTALGKLETLKALKEIAYEKNKIVRDLIKNKKLDLAEAVEIADKRLPIKEIEKSVRNLTQPMITIRNKNTGDFITVTKARAKTMGVINE